MQPSGQQSPPPRRGSAGHWESHGMGRGAQTRPQDSPGRRHQHTGLWERVGPEEPSSAPCPRGGQLPPPLKSRASLPVAPPTPGGAPACAPSFPAGTDRPGCLALPPHLGSVGWARAWQLRAGWGQRSPDLASMAPSLGFRPTWGANCLIFWAPSGNISGARAGDREPGGGGEGKGGREVRQAGMGWGGVPGSCHGVRTCWNVQ